MITLHHPVPPSTTHYDASHVRHHPISFCAHVSHDLWLQVPLAAIEAHCRNYISAPSEQPLNINDVTVDPELIQKERKAALAAAKSAEVAVETQARPSPAATAARRQLTALQSEPHLSPGTRVLSRADRLTPASTPT